jgi:hypothetical protein
MSSLNSTGNPAIKPLAEALFSDEALGTEPLASSITSECLQCGESFMPRAKSGGKPQKFCSEKCRREADAERKANAPNAPQRETPADIPEPSIVAKHPEFALVAAEPKDDGCWFIDNRQNIVLPEQQAVAIYWNERDDLVIRQERSWCDETDHVVLIQRANLCAFIEKLQQIVKEGP